MWPVDLSHRVTVLIDGRAGSGKTSLAHSMAAAWPRTAQVVSLDFLYPGWSGLADGSNAVAHNVLANTNPGFYRWDWAENQPAGWVSLDPDIDLIIEGCGAITAASQVLASWSIWCECDETLRKTRALARDGKLFAEHWEMWAAQEMAHRATHHPKDLADFIVECGLE